MDDGDVSFSHVFLGWDTAHWPGKSLGQHEEGKLKGKLEMDRSVAIQVTIGLRNYQ